jgi:hypothetical protein
VYDVQRGLARLRLNKLSDITVEQDWWPMVSLGFLNYDMSRTHSIMRVATTASPISGSEVIHLLALGNFKHDPK